MIYYSINNRVSQLEAETVQVVEFKVVTNFHSLCDPLLILESIGQMLQMALKYQPKGNGGFISPSCFFLSFGVYFVVNS